MIGGKQSGPGAGDGAGALAETVLELVAELQGVLDPVEFRVQLLEAIGRWVPSDWISLNEIGPGPDDFVAIVRPPLDEHWVARFAPLAHENPLVIRYELTKDGRAYRFSDVMTGDELHETAIYREFYAPLGVEYQMAFTLPARPGRLLAIALSRRKRDFSDRERDIVNRARPFLIQGYRNAVAYSELAATPERAFAIGSADLAELKSALCGRGLTSREAEVLVWVATGRSDAAIARGLHIRPRTVNKHLQRIYRKLMVTNRSDAATIVWSLTATAKRG
jgi:DNA-binding CsgD family transcriptional regulator